MTTMTKGAAKATALSLTRTPRLAGARFPFRWMTNLAALPRLTFNEGLEQLTWYEVRDLVSYLERMGNPGQSTVAELIVKLDRYIGTTEPEAHDRAYKTHQEADLREHYASLEVRAAELEGRNHAGRHVTYAKHSGKLPRLAAFYGRLQVGRISA